MSRNGPIVVTTLMEMSTASKRAPQAIDELAAPDRKRLTDAYERLRTAVGRYEPLRDQALDSQQPPDATVLTDARTEVREAEAALWRLRQELLGWERPSWAPSASLVADWFSEEDRVYDDLP